LTLTNILSANGGSNGYQFLVEKEIVKNLLLGKLNPKRIPNLGEKSPCRPLWRR
jgi:hypothetical protein